jgi:aminopeptidase N
VAVASGGSWRSEPVTLTGPETAYAPDGEAVLLDPYDDTWAVSVPDRATLAALPRLLPAITDGHLRAGVWNGVRSAFHNACVSPADVVEIAVASFPVEDTEDHPRRTRAWLFGRVLPLAPQGSTERLHRAVLEKLPTLAEGSEWQLAAFRAAVATATDPARLRGWLTGPPAGIEVDRGQRWRVLVRLAALGAVDRPELQRAFDADPAAEARVELTRALCSLPDPEAKEYAWSVFTGVTDLPNYEVAAAGDGMWRGGQDELTEPYVDRYFTDLPGTARVRSGWVLAEAAEAFFPRTSVDPATLDKALALAADTDLDGPLRRRLTDAADLLRRQLAVKEAFGH